MRIANISKDNMKLIEQIESKIGVVLVAYEKGDQNRESKTNSTR